MQAAEKMTPCIGGPLDGCKYPHNSKYKHAVFPVVNTERAAPLVLIRGEQHIRGVIDDCTYEYRDNALHFVSRKCLGPEPALCK